MDGVRNLLEIIREKNLAEGRLRGVLHLLIGRTIEAADGTVVSAGLTWRQLAAELKAARFAKELVAELGADPETLSPRDRERLWYAAIGIAQVDSAEAKAQADQVAKALKPLGFVVLTATEVEQKKKA